jgi:hypothetical protein
VQHKYVQHISSSFAANDAQHQYEENHVFLKKKIHTLPSLVLTIFHRMVVIASSLDLINFQHNSSAAAQT